MSLLLIDAYAMIYRAYYAFIKNPRINSQGLNTSAVFGFVNSLDDVIRRIAPTHIGIAFDPSGPTFRHEAYPAYKAQREQTPEDIRRSVPLIKQIISAMRIPILQVDGFEADDVIGTLAVQAHEMGMEVYMVTPDKDYGQLVQDGLWMYRPRHSGGFDKMGPQEVCQKYGIRTTAQVIDLLALMGDAADNVPGCPGVGEKTAVKLIGQFDSVENMLRNTDQIKGALQQKIVAHADDIRFSKFLTTIRTDVPVRIDPDSMLLQQPDTQELIRLYTELEFRTFVQRLTAQPTAQQTPAAQPDLFTQPDLFSPVADAAGAPLQQTLFDSVETTFEQHDPSKTDYQLIGDDQLDALISRLAAQRVVCFDTETTGIDPLQADLIGVSFCCSSGQAWFAYAPEDFDQCRRWAERLRPLLENPDIVKVGQNMKYDILVLSRYGIRLQGSCFDTMIAHYLLQPELRHNMDYLAEVYLNYQTIHYEDLVGPRGSQADLRKVPRERLRDYACEDADITFRLYLHFLPELEQRQLTDLFSNVEMPLVQVLADMERNGVRIDTQALRQSSDQLTAQMNELEQKIQASAGQPFNVNSPRQVGAILFETLHLDPKAKKTKSGQYVTNEETLEALRGRHPIVDDILEYRAVKKLLSTYIDALPALISPQTGKIHTSYNQTVTSTGRLSSSNPNLQNIP
ncbi:MAG: DNA polymerase I, partial [Paludibacteraceae bacterium]|nr:DNA polymerase I [Paludibacteraceae bacterium]